MNLQNRIDVLADLSHYLDKNVDQWIAAKSKAQLQNPWFTDLFIASSLSNIQHEFLSKEALMVWANQYPLNKIKEPKTIGIVMAGNIPLVGFHDFLCVFLSGHRQLIKMSSKDNVLLTQLIQYLHGQYPATRDLIKIADTLNQCDAYIATGNNQSAQHFKKYFSPFPNIIRDQKTSIAILKGDESAADLNALAQDIHLYFGLGCRNVTKIFVPKNYDFVPLLDSFKAYHFLKDFHRYNNNYDYQLSLALLNQQAYMTDGTTLLIESPLYFSPISVLYFEYYENYSYTLEMQAANPFIQCVIGCENTPFGKAQSPGLDDFADGINTMDFLISI